MRRDLDALGRERFDLLVIGAGITGVCVAHDAALRGLKVALIDKGDFGASTSSASSKLLHGGIRYLPKLQFGKVRESARERAVFQVIAPHLCNYIPFMVPTTDESFMRGRLALRAGMLLYTLACAGLDAMVADPAKKLPPETFLNRTAALKLAPQLAAVEGLTGAEVFHESHMRNSERMTLAFVKTAVNNGARAANYLRVEDFVIEGGAVAGVQVQDLAGGGRFTIQARMVVSAAGPQLPLLNRRVAGLRLRKETTGYSRGVHLVTRQVLPEHALALTTRKKIDSLVSRGGRHIFIIPWRGRSLIGTTNVSFDGDLDQVRVTGRDVLDFLDDLNEALPTVKLKVKDVHYAFTGLYPLVSEEVKRDTYQGTGEYQVVDHAEDGVGGIVSVLGAKYTTGRAVAEQAVDLIERHLTGAVTPCRTATSPLAGGDFGGLDDFVAAQYRRHGDRLSTRVISHLIDGHGSGIEELMAAAAENPGLLRPLCAQRRTLEIEVWYAVRREMALCLEDVIFRRTGLGTIGYPGDWPLTRCAAIMAALLGWDEQRQEEEIAQVRSRYHYDDLSVLENRAEESR